MKFLYRKAVATPDSSLFNYFLVSDDTRDGQQGGSSDETGEATPVHRQPGCQDQSAQPLQGLVPSHPFHVQRFLSSQECGPVQGGSQVRNLC